jgi:choline dehydrogenase-like flavoprotein
MRPAPPIHGPLTRQERLLRLGLRIFAVCSAAETLIYLLPALIGDSAGWGQLPFVAGSFVKAGMLSGLCFIASQDVRRYERLVSVLVIALALWSVAGAGMLIWGETSREVTVAGIDLTIEQIVWGGILFEGGLAVLYAVLHRLALRSRYRLEYLSVGQFRTVESLAEALLGDSVTGREALLGADEVAANVDRYLAAFRAKRKWLMKVALTGINFYPLFRFRVPLNLMHAEERRPFLEARFGDDVARRRISHLRRWLVQAAIRLAQQVVYLGYYNDERTFDEVGYVRFSRRPRYDPKLRKRPGGLEVMRPGDIRGGGLEADVAIVGSGAAAGVIGYRLAQEGRRVLMLERGPYEDPAHFTEDEAEMLCRLYRDGAVQLARDFRLQVLQGQCVGGTTVVNNAVSIPPPERVVAEWQRRLDGGLGNGALGDAVEAVRSLLEIGEQPGEVFSPGTLKFVKGVEEMGLGERARRFTPVDANIKDCLGCGYCNIGCAFGRKLSMLDTLLPRAQREFGAEALRIASECEVERIEHAAGEVSALSCRVGGRRVEVSADRYLVCAGAVSSSYLLGRSGIGGASAGRGLSFNMGSPITADFEDEVHSYDGLQITHVFEPGGGPDVIMETWFNPVLAQALAMPGWFEEHRRNMLRYPHLAATGVLVGTESNAKVEKALFGGADVVYEPTAADLRRLVEGVKLAGRIYLAAGAKRVMPATFQFHSFDEPEQLEQLDEIVTDSSDIQLGTGHPQGGNSLSLDPAEGVVDPETFGVHGTENLHLCDASVFPTSVGVNPQLTVMSLAHLAAGRIAALD